MLRSILVTGGAGFIGSNFIPYFCKKYPDYFIVNLDKLTYAGNLENLKECISFPNYTFIKGDICDENLVMSIFKQYDIKGVIHFAAESHVDTSIQNPKKFLEANIFGTFNLLETARKYWMCDVNMPKVGYENARFHHISTDEVFGTLGDSGFFKETTAYAPNSPYSSSKASSDFLVRCYYHTYGLNVTVSNCSNNYGPKQHSEKLIPKIIEKCLSFEQIPIYGDGKNIRDWLYVLDHCKAIDVIFHKGKTGDSYNIGSHNEKNNIEVVHTISSILNKKFNNNIPYDSLICYTQDRAGHDRRYAIDNSKITKELGWHPEENFESGIEKTIEWYIAKQDK